MDYCFGVDIGGTSIKMGLFSRSDGLLKNWEVPTRKGSEPTLLLRDISEAIELCLKENGIRKEEIAGVGLTAPGPVSEDGLLRGTVNIGWGDVYLGKEAEVIFGIAPVFVGNDARVAAFGEFTFGAGKEVNSLLMFTLGTGVGGGVILNGQILAGKTGTAGEIGHMTINPFETISCNCGKKGCLEQYASATGMVRIAERFLEETDKASSLRKLEKVTAKDLWDEAKKGDELALEITEYVSRLLGMAIANACYIVDPEMIVIGGGVSQAGQFLLDMIQRKYAENVFPHCRDKKFALAKLRNDAGIYGAAAMVFEK
ncbi:ROK family glucokinase [Anaerotignum sp.]|uniref:ROK family glucokinase n=1 Tax=Anaerotignum sp. TaxID=2039241 RepID=UPI0028ACBD73|nr:ROK family glucokinase [Anaerotignum sp.]